MLKFQAVAEKMAKNFRGLLFILLMFLCVFYVDYGYMQWCHQSVNMASRFLCHFCRSSISNVSFFMLTKRWVPILLSKFLENCALLVKWWVNFGVRGPLNWQKRGLK